MPQKQKFYHILTFGCQMNKNDSERIAGLLSSLSFRATTKPEKAEVLIINTCSVRQHAEDRVYGLIREWQKFRKDKSNLFIGVTGCLPGRDQDGKLLKKIKGVDWFFPIKDLPMLPAKLAGRDALTSRRGVSTSCDNYFQFSPKRKENFRIFVAIQTGCNNFCSYCVVPYARGQEKNRPVKDILAEIKQAVAKGAKEVTLLGQVVNNYQALDPENFSKNNPFVSLSSRAKSRDPLDRLQGIPPCVRSVHLVGMTVLDHFAALLWEINNIKGLERINWTAADPQYFSEELIQALTLPKQVNYLHLPAQSGDNEILKKMNRKYSGEAYLKLIKKIRKTKPDIAIGTDIIVGFCGETKKQFQNTVALYKKCAFDLAYLAQYSERSGTLAAKMFKDDVVKAEKKRRWQILQNLMEKIVWQKNQTYLGRTVSVLVDKYKNGQCLGNSSEMKLVSFLGNKKLIGKIIKVKITEAKKWVLYGKQIT